MYADVCEDSGVLEMRWGFEALGWIPRVCSRRLLTWKGNNIALFSGFLNLGVI